MHEDREDAGREYDVVFVGDRQQAVGDSGGEVCDEQGRVYAGHISVASVQIRR